MTAVGGVDQLARDTNEIVGFAHAALEDVSHAQLGGHVAHVDGLALVRERGVAGDDEEPSLPGEPRDDVFGETIREIFLVRIAAHILEGEHRIEGLSGSGSGPASGTSLAASCAAAGVEGG